MCSLAAACRRRRKGHREPSYITEACTSPDRTRYSRRNRNYMGLQLQSVIIWEDVLQPDRKVECALLKTVTFTTGSLSLLLQTRCIMYKRSVADEPSGCFSDPSLGARAGQYAIKFSFVFVLPPPIVSIRGLLSCCCQHQLLYCISERYPSSKIPMCTREGSCITITCRLKFVSTSLLVKKIPPLTSRTEATELIRRRGSFFFRIGSIRF